jgi:hypothetical protein
VTVARGTKPWPPDDFDAIAWPPAALPGKRPKLRPDRPDVLWRLHWEEDPNDPPRYPTGKWRFDAPDGSYPVTYASTSELHVFVEVYGDIDDAQIIEDQAQRRISSATLNRPVDVIDLGDAATLRDLKLDGRVATTRDYTRTMLWSQRLRQWLPEAEGIRYLGRKGGRDENLCLFLDKCADALDWTPYGTLADNEDLVLRASDAFNLTFDFTIPGIWPAGGSTW